MSVQDVMPFSAVAGNPAAKKAVLCLLINPELKCLLVTGAPGTGKTALIRSIASLDGNLPVVNVPIGVSDDRLFGSVNIEKAIATGNISVEKGLFGEADGGILSVDGIDLMDQRLALQTAETAVHGEVVLEREGMSSRFGCDVSLIATASIAGRKINGHLKDRFDMCVRMERPPLEEYVESLRNNIEMHGPETDFAGKYEKADREVFGLIQSARRNLADVRVLKRHRDAIARACRKYGIVSYRGPIACAHVAATLAAMEGRGKTSDGDVVEAIGLTLAHRRRIFGTVKNTEPEKKDCSWAHSGAKRFVHDDRKKNTETSLVEKINSPPNPDNVVAAVEPLTPDDIETKIGEKFETIDIMESADSNGAEAETQKNRYIESPMGRYGGFRIPKGECRDLAFDATVRAAAPYQTVRNRTNGRIKIEKSDIREKVRTKHVEQTFLFIMDSSGSLLIRNRIAKVKAAIVSMLETHYVKRDRVGLMTFNDEKTEIVMRPTRAIDELSGTIDGIEIGCGTPLSAALVKCWEFVTNYRKNHPEEVMHIVLFSDGKATSSIDPEKNPEEEALGIASNLISENVDWIVIDSGLGYTKNDMPARLAEKLGGRFFLLDDLKSEETVSKVW